MKKTSKKLIAWLITVCMVMSMVPTVAFATDSVTITADTSAVGALEAGSTFTVPVVVSDNTGFTNFDLGVDYDDSVLMLTRVSNSSALAANMSSYESDTTTGLISAAGVNSGSDYAYDVDSERISTDGTLFTLYFTVNTDVYNGDTEISIEANPNADTAMKNGDDVVTVSFASGSVTISGGDEEPEPVEVYDTDGASWGDGYDTITDALAAMLDGEVHDEGYTVKLTEDVTEANYVTFNCGSAAVSPFNVTIDVNGNTLTSSNTTYVFHINTSAYNAGTTLNITSSQEGGEIGTATYGVYAYSNNGYMYYVTMSDITVHGRVHGMVQMIDNCVIDDYVYYTGTASEWTDGTVTGTIQNSTVSGSTYGIQLTSGHIIVENSSIYGSYMGIVHGASAASDTSLTINGDDTIIEGGDNDGGSHALAVQEGTSGSRTTTINGGSFTSNVGLTEEDETGAVICAYAGETTITGGSFGTDVHVAVGAWGGDVNITGGTFTSECWNTVEVWDDASTVEISGGKITGTGVIGVCMGAGELTISGDADISGTYGLEVCGGTTTILGGTITGTSGSLVFEDDNITIGGTEVLGPYMAGKISYYDSTTGTDIDVISGYFNTLNTNVTDNIADGSYLTSSVNDEGYYQVIVGESPYISIVFDVDGTQTEYTLEKGDTFADLTAPTVVPAYGYEFDDWYYADGAAVSDTDTFTADTTITAKYTYVAVEEVVTETTVEDNTASAEVPEDTTVAAEEAFTITATTTSGDDTTETKVAIPATVVEALANATELVIATNEGTVTFDNDALSDIATATTAVTIAVSEKATTDYVDAQATALADSKKILDISITSGDEDVTFSNGSATITTAYTKTANTPTVYYVADNGTKTAVSSSYDNEKGELTFTTNHFSVYSIEEDGTTAVDYTVTTTLDNTAYRSGETITATVTVTAEEGVDIGSFDMDLSYDSTYVTLGTVSAGSSFASMSASGNQVFYADGSSAVTVATDGTVMFTVTFTANADVSATATEIGVTDVKITPEGVNGNTGTITLVSDAAQIIDTVVITLSADTNGTYGGTATITVDKDSTLASLKTATGYAVPVAADNYTFTGWYNGDTLLDDNATFAANTTITAKFAAGTFDLTVNAGNATVTKSGESTAYTEDATVEDAVTYGTDFSFTVAANAGYIVNTVSYQVGTETAVTMTATDGVYKIDGDAITDDITILVSTTAYYAITFSSGDNASFGTDDSNVVHYAKAGSTGLYTDATCTTAVTALPTATASTGYRLADSPWGTTTASDILGTITHTAATTYTSSVVKTYTISFVAGDSNGTVATTYNGTYDTGATVTVPEVTANTGYVFNGWTTTSTALASNAETLTAIEDVTYTATFTEGTYAVTFPTVTGITFTDKTGLTNGEATYNQTDDVTFEITETGVEVTAVSYTVSGGSAVTITAVNGVYTIPSSAITNAVSITVTASNVYTVAFTTDSSNGTVGGTTSFNVTSGSTLGTTDFANVTVTPAAGYQFDGWYISAVKYATPENEIVSANVTYTAQFSLIQYTITADTGSITFVDGYGDYATYGTDVTFTVTGDSGIVTGVSLGETSLTAVDGVYTIPYTSFGTIAALEVTVAILDASIDFIAIGTTDDDDYMADVADFSGQKIMVLTVTGADGATNYAVGDTSMFWSSEYSAYVRLVDDSATVQSVSATISSNENAVTSIDYSGDINGDGEVRSDDAGIINSILHGTRQVTTSELYLFMSDVSGNKGLSTSDITAIMNTYFGI